MYKMLREEKQLINMIEQTYFDTRKKNFSSSAYQKNCSSLVGGGLFVSAAFSISDIWNVFALTLTVICVYTVAARTENSESHNKLFLSLLLRIPFSRSCGNPLHNFPRPEIHSHKGKNEANKPEKPKKRKRVSTKSKSREEDGKKVG